MADQLSVVLTADVANFRQALGAAAAEANRTSSAVQTLSTNVSRNIQRVNAINLSGFTSALRAGQISVTNFTTSTQRIGPAVTAASAAVVRSTRDFTGLSRVIQDLPFGFIGIQNNLTQLLPAAGGAGLALSVLVSAITFAQTGTSNWTRGLVDNKKALDGTKKASEEYAESLSQLDRAQLKGAQNASKEITELDTLYKVSQNTSLSYKVRKEAVDELQKQYPSYFKNIKDEVVLAGGAEKAYKLLASAIISTARARAKQDEIGKNSDKILEIENKLRDSDKERLNLERERSVERKNARSVLDLDLSRDTKLLRIYKEQTEARKEWSALEVKNAQLASSIQKDVAGGADVSGAVGGIDETGKKVVSLSDILSDLNKGLEKTEVQFGSTFGERNKEQISVYQSAIDSATDAFGRQSKAVKDLQEQQQKLLQLTDSKSVSANTGIEAPRNIKGNKEGVTVGGAKSTDFFANFSEEEKKVYEAQARLIQSQQQFADDFNNIALSGITDTLGNIGSAIGESLMNGGDALEAAGSALLSGFGDFLSEYGRLLVAYGLAAVAKGKLDIVAAVPGAGLIAGPAAILAGVALQVAGAAIGSFVSGGGKKSSSSGQKEAPRPIPQFASGVQNFKGGLAMVGERGPELIDLPTGASVIPSGRTERMMRSGSSDVVLNGNFGISMETLYFSLKKTEKKLGRLG